MALHLTLTFMKVELTGHTLRFFLPFIFDVLDTTLVHSEGLRIGGYQ